MIAYKKENTTMINKDDYLKISKELQKFHEVFDKFWKITNIVEDTSIPTASTQFDPEDFKNTLVITINPEFWNCIDFYKKIFLICHEYLHIILFHGFRIFNLQNVDLKRANIAADLIVHIFIKEKFGMIKEKIDPNDIFYWVENVFPNEDTNNTFEYFYNKLLNKSDEELNAFSLADEHGTLPNNMESVKKISEFINDNLSEEGKESLKKLCTENLEAGQQSLGNLISVSEKKEKPIVFEKLIKNWLNKKLIKTEKEIELWTRENRRISKISTNLILPGEYDYIHNSQEKNKLEVYIFLDASGSCSKHIERFYNLARIINLKYFTPHFYTFDNIIFEIKNKKIYGGGGTSFKIIENFVSKLDKYPDSIFVLTDGYGDPVHPLHSDRWLWFLTENYIRFIPPQAKYYFINDLK